MIEMLESWNCPDAEVKAYDADSEDYIPVSGSSYDEVENVVTLQTDYMEYVRSRITTVSGWVRDYIESGNANDAQVWAKELVKFVRRSELFPPDPNIEQTLREKLRYDS